MVTEIDEWDTLHAILQPAEEQQIRTASRLASEHGQSKVRPSLSQCPNTPFVKVVLAPYRILKFHYVVDPSKRKYCKLPPVERAI